MGSYQKQASSGAAKTIRSLRTFSTPEAKYYEIQRLRDVAGNLETSLKSFRDGQKKGVSVSAEGLAELARSRRDLANVYFKIKELSASLHSVVRSNRSPTDALPTPAQDRERLAQLEFQQRKGSSGEWSGSLTKELRQIQNRLNVPEKIGKVTTVRIQSPLTKHFIDPEFGHDESLNSMDGFLSQINAGMRAAKTPEQKKAIAAIANSVGKSTTWADQGSLYGTALTKVGSILPEFVDSSIEEIYDLPFVKAVINQGILAPPVAGDFIRAYSRNNPDVLPRVAKHGAKVIPYAIPYLGQALMVSQGMQVAGTALTKGPLAAAEDVWHGMNPFEPGLDPEERAIRAVTIFFGVKEGLRKAGRMKGRIDDSVIQRKIVESGRSKDYADAVVRLARAKIDDLQGESLTGRAKAAVDQVRRRRVEEMVKDIQQNSNVHQQAPVSNVSSDTLNHSRNLLSEDGNENPSGHLKKHRGSHSTSRTLRTGEYAPWKKGKDIWSIGKEDIDELLSQGVPKFIIKTIDRVKHGKGAYHNSKTGATFDLQGSTLGLQPGNFGTWAFNSKTPTEINRLNTAAANTGGNVVLVLASPENGIRSHGEALVRGEFEAGEKYWGRHDELLEASEEILRELGLLPSRPIKTLGGLWEHFDSFRVRDKNRFIDAVIDSDWGLVPEREKAIKLLNDTVFDGMSQGDVGGILRLDYKNQAFHFPGEAANEVYPYYTRGLHYGIPAGGVKLTQLLGTSFNEFCKTLPERLKRANARNNKKLFDPNNISFKLAYNLWRLTQERGGLASEANIDQLYKLAEDKSRFRSQVDKDSGGEVALYGSGGSRGLQPISARSNGASWLEPGRSLPRPQATAPQYFRRNGFSGEGERLTRTGNFARRGIVGGSGSDGEPGVGGGVAVARASSAISQNTLEALSVGSELLSQAHGPHLAKVVADDIAWHPAAAAQAMAHFASGDKRFREALADNGHEPDRFVAMLRSGAAGSKPANTAVAQLAEIYA